MKYCLVLYEVWFATGEDCAVRDQQVLGNPCVRNHNEELVAYPDREQRPINPRPNPQNALRITTQGSITKRRARRDMVSIFVHEVSPEGKGKDRRQYKNYK